MHILTGLLITRLLGLKKKGNEDDKAPQSGSPLLGAPSIISVVHALPGRTRYRVPSLVGRVETAARLGDALGQIEAIRRVDVSPATGSVLLEFDENRVESDMLAAALIRMLGLERELKKDVEPVAVAELKEFTRSLNRAFFEKTGGVLDLRSALFIALAVAGVQKLAKQGASALPAGFTLLWWAGHGLLGGKQTNP
jgi:hypothetical protein